MQSHLPSYAADLAKFKEAGVDVIAFVSVNDVFVMQAWGESQGVTGKVIYKIVCFLLALIYQLQ